MKEAEMFSEGELPPVGCVCVKESLKMIVIIIHVT